MGEADNVFGKRSEMLRFCILGPLEVSVPDGASGSGLPGGRLAGLGPPKQRALLAVLLLHAGEIVPTERLIELLWEGHPPKTALHSIQIYVSELRKILEPAAGRPVILTWPPGYLLEAELDSIDARRFERLVEDGARALGADDPTDAAVTLRTALGLWRGQPLADFTYEEFSQAEIRRLQELRLTAIEHLSRARLDAGHAQEVLPMLEAAIREDPLRERLREGQMLALYRSGRHPEALRVYQGFRELLAEELGVDPSPDLQRLQERILLHDPSLGPEKPQREPGPAVRNPYKGLRPFSEADAEDFFGREVLVRELLESLARGVPLLAAVGPSGSGKSSVVAAGLIPALRSGAIDGSEGWVLAQMQPGSDPFGELRAALVRALDAHPSSLEGRVDEEHGLPIAAAVRTLPAGGRLVLVIDQFEELFTMGDQRSTDRFLGDLVSAVGTHPSSVQSVLCLRGDFYDRPLMHAEFASVFVPGVVNVMPMTPAEIEKAVVEPARRAGVDVEPALLAEMIADTVHQPGALPLLQYALTELFEQRADASLTVDSYHALGGVRGTLSRRAEEVFGTLDAKRQGVAVQLFLRLVRIQDGGKPIRRRLPISDLTALELDPVALSEVLEGFGHSRLLSLDRDPPTGKATVEVAHDALLTEWERLAGWIEDHRDDLQRHEALASAAYAWEGAGRHPDFLLTGSRLSEHERWSRGTDLRLTATQQAFLDAGLERRRRQAAAEAERLRRQRRLERRARRRLVALVATLTLLAAGTTYGILAWPGPRIPDVVMVFEGPGDAGVNDLMARGFDRAVSELGISADRRAVPEAQWEAEIRRLAEDGVELIIGSPGCSLNAIAADHPDTRFIGQDCGEPRPPNVSTWLFATEQGSYLMGAAAALKSESHVVGFVGGVDVEPIWPFHAGFAAGARAVDPDIRVRYRYLSEPPDSSGFDSPALGRQNAEELYAEGADVIFHAAGRSGIGVFEAALDLSAPGRKLWAIGVDSDQYRSIAAADPTGQPAALQRHILTSLVLRYDQAVYTMLSEYAQGTLKPGLHEFDLANGGMDIAYSGGLIDDIKDALVGLRGRIIAGEIRVPSMPTSETHAFINLRTGKVTSLPVSIAGDSYVVSPDGKRFAIPCCVGGPVSVISVAKVDGSDVRQVTPDGVDAYGARWSPDGTMLVYQGRHASTSELGDLFVLDLTTLVSTRITDLEGRLGWQGWWFMSPQFSPDGRTILFHMPRPVEAPRWDLWSVSVTGGELTLVRRNAGFGQYSPDGGTISFLSPVNRSFTGEGLWLVDVAGGEPRLLVEEEGIRWPRWSPDGTRISYVLEAGSPFAGGTVYVVDVTTGKATEVAHGDRAEWFDDHTLTVS